ncbi:hypothetical protein RB614_23215 [Phytohabitans sp. ZYX-F-186]|uniref:DUF4321 domain-containing protein n=1 Tax=Phytohabitans maris TaxID=3071409 RepID=A0ABU0ZNC1_9ACTN|nr:hypothetical protein [Phytohabitans sp. ZYX-F-186]MDQ7907432.1 hypothetical protein [Phytohabitans sp. ZYX-F-186]
MKAVMLAVSGGVAGFLAAVLLGAATFGIGMYQEGVYSIPLLWEGGVQDVEGGFEFVVAPNVLGNLGLVFFGGLAGLLVGLLRKAEG